RRQPGFDPARGCRTMKGVEDRMTRALESLECRPPAVQASEPVCNRFGYERLPVAHHLDRFGVRDVTNRYDVDRTEPRQRLDVLPIAQRGAAGRLIRSKACEHQAGDGAIGHHGLAEALIVPGSPDRRLRRIRSVARRTRSRSVLSRQSPASVTRYATTAMAVQTPMEVQVCGWMKRAAPAQAASDTANGTSPGSSVERRKRPQLPSTMRNPSGQMTRTCNNASVALIASAAPSAPRSIQMTSTAVSTHAVSWIATCVR